MTDNTDPEIDLESIDLSDPEIMEFGAKAFALFQGDDPEAIAEAFADGDFEKGAELSDLSEDEIMALLEELRREADEILEDQQ